MARKIDPINKKNYGAVTIALTVSDVKGAMSFYQKAFGFTKRSLMNGPDGKPIHGELTLRGTTLMLGPEMPGRTKGARESGSQPFSLYLLVEDADKVFSRALKLGATMRMPVTDMFWGDRSGTLTDPDGYQWMVATHVAEPTPQELKKKMKEQMKSMAPPDQASREEEGAGI